MLAVGENCEEQSQGGIPSSEGASEESSSFLLLREMKRKK